MALSDAARAFLNERRFATLATINPDGTPQLSVMWYVLRGDTIVFNTEKGRKKEANLLRDQRVSLCIEDEYRYITISGTAQIEDDPVIAQCDIRELAIRYKGPEGGGEYYERIFAPFERVSYYVPLERVFERL